MINLTYFEDVNSYDSKKESLKFPNISYVNIDSNNQQNIYIVDSKESFIIINYEIYNDEQLSEINNLMQTYNGKLPLLMRTDLISEANLNGQDITDQLNKNGIYTFSGISVDEKLNELKSLIFDENNQLTDYALCIQGPVEIGDKFKLKIKFKPQITEVIGLFYESLALKQIDNQIFINNPEINDFTFLFYNCKYLNNVNEKLFFYNINATDFKYVFYNCSNLNNITSKLFKNNTSATTFRSSFYGCVSLTKVPNDLFYNNINCTSFYETFCGCDKLSEIPYDLFSKNTANTSFFNTFSGCTSLTTMPENLFDNNTKVTFFLGTFDNCTNLTSIPSNLFINNTAVIDFDYTFRNCSGLTGTVPTDSDGTPIYNRSGSGKSGYDIVTGHKDCFLGCTGLTDYNSIPQDWGGPEAKRIVTYITTEHSQEIKLVFNGGFLNYCKIEENGEELPVTDTGALYYTFTNPGVHQVELKFKDDATTLESAFDSCSRLTSISENLFSNCTAVTDFTYTFYGCIELTTIPENLFSNNTEATNFRGTFYNCSGLTGNVPVDSDGTPIYNRSGSGKSEYAIVTSYDNCFRNCTGLADYSSIPSAWK